MDDKEIDIKAYGFSQGEPSVHNIIEHDVNFHKSLDGYFISEAENKLNYEVNPHHTLQKYTIIPNAILFYGLCSKSHLFNFESDQIIV